MAQEFCQKLSEITGKKYQLPTEAQWEYTCRAGTTTKYFFGEKYHYIKKYAHMICHQHSFSVNKENNKFLESFIHIGVSPANINLSTVFVMSFKPNPWGLHHLLGNVWEWCEDDWIDGYYGHPSDGSAVNTGSNQKVVRGGCFNSSQNDCCSFSRSLRDSNIADRTIWFRVVCVP